MQTRQPKENKISTDYKNLLEFSDDDIDHNESYLSSPFFNTFST